MKKLQTVCVIRKDGKILLGLKKRGFGLGTWNGFGGKVEELETLLESVKRETREEAGIEITNVEKIGIIDFKFEDSAREIECHFFTADIEKGEPTETEEMKPQWFDIENIPYSRMWPDDKLWVPMFLAGKKFRGRFLFNKPSTTDEISKILEEELLEVSAL
ncbi:MAG: 8-oxo-dGTP diphosphatase [Candidatus Paceibacterota bacterium]|jgi:8-oxo-dGTP pyrophosphatase MutT (NUDIX family)